MDKATLVHLAGDKCHSALAVTQSSFEFAFKVFASRQCLHDLALRHTELELAFHGLPVGVGEFALAAEAALVELSDI